MRLDKTVKINIKNLENKSLIKKFKIRSLIEKE